MNDKSAQPQLRSKSASSEIPSAALGKFDRGVSMLTWGYNEEALVGDFMGLAIELLNQTATDWEIVFVDDCSTDNTARVVQSFANHEPRIRLIRHDKNMNVGMACRTAVANARKEFLFWQTVDWSYDIRNLRIFLELLNHFDVVQGIRPVPIRLLSYIPVVRSIYRIKKRSDNFMKAIISLGNYYLLRILFGVRFQDFQNVTFYPSKLAQSHDMVGRTSFVNPEFLLKSYFAGARFIEVPIRFVPRKQGVAKGTRPITVLRSVIDTFRNWILWGFEKRSGYVRTEQSRITRVAEPFSLEPEILQLTLPLFRDFR